MKTFIYSLTPRSSSGYVTATIYRIKRNKPEYLGTTRWNTASFAGQTPEVVSFLMKQKEVTQRNHYSRPDTYHLEQV